MRKVSVFLKILGGIGKSLYVNFKVLPFAKAIRLPILVSCQTRLQGISKKTIKIDTLKIRTGMIRIGILEHSEGVIGPEHSYFGTDGSSKIIFGGDFSMVYGGCLKATKGGILKMGDKVTFNTHSKVLCSHETTIGNNVLFGWNVTLKDGDGHPICDEEGQIFNHSRPIIIGNNVWVGSEVTLLKGTVILDGSVVGYGSIVTKAFDEESVIIVGSPAKIMKRNIRWNA